MKTSGNQFVVVDENGWTTSNDEASQGQWFSTFAAAEKRAKQLAKDQPGETVGIFQRVADVRSDIAEPKTVRRSN